MIEQELDIEIDNEIAGEFDEGAIDANRHSAVRSGHHRR